MKKIRILVPLFLFLLLFLGVLAVPASAEAEQTPVFTVYDEAANRTTTVKADATQTAVKLGDLLLSYLKDETRLAGNKITLQKDVNFDTKDDYAAVISRDTEIDLNGHAIYVYNKGAIRMTGGKLNIYSSAEGGKIQLGGKNKRVSTYVALFAMEGESELTLGVKRADENFLYQSNFTLYCARAVLVKDRASALVRTTVYHNTVSSPIFEEAGNGNISLCGVTVYNPYEKSILFSFSENSADRVIENCRFYSSEKSETPFLGGSLTLTLKDCEMTGWLADTSYGDVKCNYEGTFLFNRAGNGETADGRVFALGEESKTVSFPVWERHYAAKICGALKEKADTAVIYWGEETEPTYWTVGAAPLPDSVVKNYVEEGIFYSLVSGNVTLTPTAGGDSFSLRTVSGDLIGKEYRAEANYVYSERHVSFSMLDSFGELTYADWNDDPSERGRLLGDKLANLTNPTEFVLWGDVALDRDGQIWLTNAFSLDLNGFTFNSRSAASITIHTDNQGSTSALRHVYFYSSRPGGKLVHSSTGYFISIDPPYVVHFGAYDDKYRDNLTISGGRLIQGWGGGFEADGCTIYCTVKGTSIFSMANRADAIPRAMIRNCTLIHTGESGMFFDFAKNISFDVENCTFISYSGNVVMAKQPDSNSYYGGVPVTMTLRGCTFVNVKPQNVSGIGPTAVTYVYEDECAFGLAGTDEIRLTGYVIVSTGATAYTIPDEQTGEKNVYVKRVILAEDAEVATVTFTFDDEPISVEKWLLGSVPVCSIPLEDGYSFSSDFDTPLDADVTIPVTIVNDDGDRVKMSIGINGSTATVTFYVLFCDSVRSLALNGKAPNKLPKTVNINETYYYPIAVEKIPLAELASRTFSLTVTNRYLSGNGNDAVTYSGELKYENLTVADYLGALYAAEDMDGGALTIADALVAYLAGYADAEAAAPYTALMTERSVSSLNVPAAGKLSVGDPITSLAWSKNGAALTIKTQSDYTGYVLVTYAEKGTVYGYLFDCSETNAFTADFPVSDLDRAFHVLTTASGTYAASNFDFSVGDLISSDADRAVYACLCRMIGAEGY